MQLVFLNTLEKQTGEGRVTQAQVSIGEKGGIWTVLWNDAGELPEGGQSVWFEGTSWEEMIAAFRHGVAVKMGDGYVPVLDGMLEEHRAGAGSYYSMLHCYGELHADAVLFDALREWRLARARTERKAAYLIASNRMLSMISAFVPHTPDELKQLPGWGDGKHAQYGEEVLAVTRQHQRTTSFPLDWAVDRLPADVYAQWLYKQKENRFRQEMDRHRQKRSILEGVRDGQSLDELQAQLDMPRRELLERIEQLENEGYDLTPLVERELQVLPGEEQERIVEALRSVGDKYLKPVLTQVYGSEKELEGKQLEPLYERLRLVRMRFRRTAAGGTAGREQAG